MLKIGTYFLLRRNLSIPALEAASERFLPPLEVEEVAKGLVGVEVRFKDILASSNR